MIAEALGCPRLELFTRLNEQLAPNQLAGLGKKIKRLEKHEPLQYVLGWTEFMGSKFKCDSRALIPRPETEELAEMVCGYEQLWRTAAPAIIDLGTGTGCLAISLALRQKSGKFTAIDVSPEAIALARENAEAHGVAGRIKFICADLTAAQLPPGFDAVIANPPYVASADFSGLDKNVRLWEPRLALDGGPDGLQVIRRLVKKAFELLKPGCCLFMEIGAAQCAQVQELLAAAGFQHGLVRRDLSGRNRMAMAIKSGGDSPIVLTP